MRYTIILAFIWTSFGSFVWAVPLIQPMEVTKPAMEATVQPRKNIIMPIGENHPTTAQAPVTQSPTPPAKSGGGGAMGYLLPLLALLLLYKKEEN